MNNVSAGLLSDNRRTGWVRLRTLVVLRWFAIFGQIIAIVVAQRVMGLQLAQGLCFMAVGALVMANVFAFFIYPENKRLSESEVLRDLIFDLTQLSVLLALTGGLNNPFALLILAPVAISATALKTGPTILVGAVAIVLITLVMWFHIPLRDQNGMNLQLPRIFVTGFWVAIVIGVVFLSLYARRVTQEVNSMSEALMAAQMSLLREQKIADIAGVVAATAHELGTPLATIKLASNELAEDLSDDPVLSGDARLIHEQAVRCGEILHSMGEAGKDDRLLHRIPLQTLLQEAAEPHLNRGKSVLISNDPNVALQRPVLTVWRRPEIIHGLRNMIQNAVDFSSSTVWVDSTWTRDHVTIRIVDDGPGFSQQVIGRIGDPFITFGHPSPERKRRPGYQGMGLGLFIAKTLLERSGADLSFANARDTYSESPEVGKRCGAIVEAVWPISVLCPPPEEEAGGLGANQPLKI